MDSKISFKKRKKYFEEEIHQQSHPNRPSDDVNARGSKKISLVSDQDLAEMLRREEELRTSSNNSR